VGNGTSKEIVNATTTPKRRRRKNPSSELTVGREKNPKTNRPSDRVTLLRKKDPFRFFEVSINKSNFNQVQLQFFWKIVASFGCPLSEHLENFRSDDSVTFHPSLFCGFLHFRTVLP
jgi:hypothetical protein